MTASAERISSKRNSSVGVTSPNPLREGPSRTPQPNMESRTKCTIARPTGSFAEVHDMLSPTSVSSGDEEPTDMSETRRDQRGAIP